MDPASSNHHRIEIYLPVHDVQISFLSIPQSEVQRLSTRPLKWMRFVMFSICGARGDLSATPNGPPVNYECTLLDRDRYYYKPSENFAFVDYHALDDRITSSARTPHKYNFREEVKERDGLFCVFTGASEIQCDAAHLIPKSKGTEYIKRVIENRTKCYPTQPPSISDIDAVENAMFLYKGLHNRFRIGAVAFLKTPNFAMESTDIPRIERVSSHTHRITLHQFRELCAYDPVVSQGLLDRAASGDPPHPYLAYATGLHVDALFPETDAQYTPPAIILDFMYGTAAYGLWKSETLHGVVGDYFSEHYESIAAPLPPLQRNDSDNFDGSSYRPPSEAERARGNILASTMDEMNLVMMFFSRTTPQEIAKARERKMEKKELMAQQASRTKVVEWKRTVDYL